MVDDRTWKIAQIIHEERIRFCWGKKYVGVRDPWPTGQKAKRPGDFGYEPIPWVDIAVAQAKAIVKSEKENGEV